MLQLFRQKCEEKRILPDNLVCDSAFVEKIEVKDLPTAHAIYRFNCYNTTNCFKLEVQLLPENNHKKVPIGFVIENIPPVLQKLLSLDRLSKIEEDRIPSEIAEVISDYRSQFGRDGHLLITQPGEHEHTKYKTIMFLKSQNERDISPGIHFYKLVSEFFTHSAGQGHEKSYKAGECLRALLPSRAVIERYQSSRDAIKVKAWDRSDAPGLTIGKRGLIPGLFDKARKEALFVRLAGGSEGDVIDQLLYIQKKGFRFFFTNSIAQPTSTFLNSLLTELEECPNLMLDQESHTNIQILRIREFLKGYEVLSYNRPFSTQNRLFEFSRLKVMAGYNVEPAISFEVPGKLEMRFFLPSFIFVEDKEASLLTYVSELAKKFSENPADAVDQIILDQHEYDIPLVIDPSSNQEFSASLYGFNGLNIRLNHGTSDFRAINILLSLYASDIFDSGVKVTPMEEVLSRDNTYQDQDFKFSIVFYNGLKFDVYIGSCGISSIEPRYTVTNSLIADSSIIGPVYRSQDEMTEDDLTNTMQIVRNLVLRGKALTPNMVSSEAGRIIFDLFGII